jgi:hypothetical protein
MKVKLIIIITFLCLQACKNTKSASNQNQDLQFVIIEESACEGNCPVYSMTIYSNGKAEFVGKENVKSLGEHNYQFSKLQIQPVFEDLKNLNFESFIDKENYVIDLPETKITYNNQSLIVKDLRNIPQEFKEFIEKLKAITRSTNFIN